jgi:hypothetical protein
MLDKNTFLDALLALRNNIAKLGPRDQEFAKSLISQRDSKGSLSEAQAFWVVKLAQRIDAPPPAPVTVAVASDAGMAAIHALFAKARKHLKRPAIQLHVEGEPVNIRLSVAGPAAKHPGTINVADAAPFGQGRWFGRIQATGQFETAAKSPPTAAILAKLSAFSCNPAAVASEHGKLTGSCCFCSKPLSDPKSTAVGYGKICAGHYDLPWGEVKTPEALAS